jgi:hypothetical protein
MNEKVEYTAGGGDGQTKFPTWRMKEKNILLVA